MTKWSLFGAAALIASVMAACSSSDGGESGGGSPTPAAQCNADPTTCATGTTCWPTSTTGDFGCVAPGQGLKGATCASYVSQATCAANLLCWASADPNDGICVPFCKTNADCAGGETCTTIVFPGGSQAKACIATGSDDGGTPDAADETTPDAGDEAETPDAADDDAADDAATD